MVGHWNAWFDATIYIRDANKLPSAGGSEKNPDGRNAADDGYEQYGYQSCYAGYTEGGNYLRMYASHYVRVSPLCRSIL